MGTKHTPGPWKAQKPLYQGWKVYSANHGEGNICFMHEKDDNAEANARLIAAAPELLSACKKAAAILEIFFQEYGEPTEGTLRNDFVEIVAAIEKAEKGE